MEVKYPDWKSIAFDKTEKKFCCFYCKKEMLKHLNNFKCPVCGNTFKEKVEY